MSTEAPNKSVIKERDGGEEGEGGFLLLFWIRVVWTRTRRCCLKFQGTNPAQITTFGAIWNRGSDNHIVFYWPQARSFWWIRFTRRTLTAALILRIAPMSHVCRSMCNSPSCGTSYLLPDIAIGFYNTMYTDCAQRHPVEQRL